MGLLKKASNEQAYAKIGVFGFPGSGKTHTGMLIAQGIAKKTGKKNIAFYDTETGSDWWVNRMPKNKELYVSKSCSFNSLLTVINECCDEGIDILMIDSITHVWRALIEAYQEKYRKTDLTMLDWTKIKTQWARYTRAFLNSPIHIIVCGRAGFTYDFEKNDKGKLEPKKTGTKMKAEIEFEFEPSLVIEMSTEQKDGEVINCAHIKKDRSDRINGKDFKMPTFKNFEPHFTCLNLGGVHKSVDEKTGQDGEVFREEGDQGATAEELSEKLNNKPPLEPKKDRF